MESVFKCRRLEPFRRLGALGKEYTYEHSIRLTKCQLIWLRYPPYYLACELIERADGSLVLLIASFLVTSLPPDFVTCFLRLFST